jgi:hypothetical protein
VQTKLNKLCITIYLTPSEKGYSSIYIKIQAIDRMNLTEVKQQLIIKIKTIAKHSSPLTKVCRSRQWKGKRLVSGNTGKHI